MTFRKDGREGPSDKSGRLPEHRIPEFKENNAESFLSLRPKPEGYRGPVVIILLIFVIILVILFEKKILVFSWKLLAGILLGLIIVYVICVVLNEVYLLTYFWRH